jgi:hypothetical protein
MGAPRKNPPSNAAETIQGLAAQGFSNIGIAKHFGVAKETVKRWLDDDEALQEAFDSGREVERQALHAAVYRSAMEGKPANVNAFFLLKARFGYVEADNRSTNINVGVTVSPSVMIVRDHGSDEEWAAKSAAQQAQLVLHAAHSPVKTLDAPKPEIEDAIIVQPAQLAHVASAVPQWYPSHLVKPPAPPMASYDESEDNDSPNGYQPKRPTSAPHWRGNA